MLVIILVTHPVRSVQECNFKLRLTLCLEELLKNFVEKYNYFRFIVEKNAFVLLQLLGRAVDSVLPEKS